ncbi:DUF6520 family protein [Paraflavitalea sp. CAU 1676]|uniref:DUF6520 family protein n=1 Tax=Paraflavitalea sp. CAU 1676 TaxID=3032598 RepID=UPI0023DB39AC|nr:DUF6520 family protein [Paraflavitalea sp. CAU 1676]MDF2189602.1 DUF6520 family protein [Paraflavitalea sp. CAU 1676]
MKKSNVSLMVIAAVAAITSAFATRPDCLQCEDTQQYHKNGNVYEPLGAFGVDYDCDFEESITCTYYRPNPGQQPNVYAACRLGIWIDMAGRPTK